MWSPRGTEISGLYRGSTRLHISILTRDLRHNFRGAYVANRQVTLCSSVELNRLLLLLFLTFSALVANTKKTTLHGGQSRSWSAEQGKKEKEKVWQRTPPPPPPARCSFGEKKKKRKKEKIRKSRGASTCLGATQAGVTQVVSVRLASVQGFLRLVS